MLLRRRSTEPAEPSVRHRLRLREIHGHVTATRDTLTAWYVLSPQRWSFTTESQREALINEYARRLASLTGHKVHLRVTNRPYPAHEWAQALHENTPHPLPGWSEHLKEAQGALRSSTLSDKQVFLGVDLQARARFPMVRSAFAGLDGARNEIEAQEQTLARLGEIVAGPGMGGRPARTGEVEWLMHRSLRLGLPAPTRLTESDLSWEVYDVPTFTDGLWYRFNKFGATVEITADYNGTLVTRHVAVLTIGRMGAITIPQTSRDPWMQHTDRLPFPVEWASTFDVLAGPEARRQTERKRLRIRDQQSDYRQHGIEEPLDLHQKAEHARRIEHETTEGDPILAARCYGTHRLAVAGATVEECKQRVQAVMDAYEGTQITIQHPRTFYDGAAQYGLLREFIPGERVSTSAYTRRLPVRMLAAGLPHVSSTVGDRRGPYMGHTVGTSRQAFMFDLHYSMEVLEKSGLVPVVGELGSGKSGVIVTLAYEEVMRGITTTILDPSGPMAKMCKIPRIRDHARHIDLVHGDDGVLNPYSVIGVPLRENYPTEEEWREAGVFADKNRKMLATDVARMLLPAQVDEMPLTPIVLADAIRAVGGSPHGSLWDVVAALRTRDREGAEHAHNLANYLNDMAEMPQSRLFFPNTAHDTAAQVTDTLLVLTMQGLQLPGAHQDRRTWSTAEQIAVPLLHLAAHYATRRAYGLTRHERKMVGLDEAGMMGQWGSGRALFTNLGRDTRKWNLAVPVASQNATDILSLDVGNFISAAFVGRTEDPDTARDALRLLRISQGAGYEGVLGGLSPQIALADGSMRRGAREFLVKDPLGHVEKVRIDRSHQPDVLTALDTTAAPAQRERAEAVS